MTWSGNSALFRNSTLDMVFGPLTQVPSGREGSGQSEGARNGKAALEIRAWEALSRVAHCFGCNEAPMLQQGRRGGVEGDLVDGCIDGATNFENSGYIVGGYQ